MTERYANQGARQHRRGLPSEVPPAGCAVVLVHLLRLYVAGTPVQHATLVAATGLSRDMVNRYLRRLRNMGLVDWVPGTMGTIRPTLAVVVPHR